jgi:N-acetylmuramoyl-L-alanine amidase
VIALWLAACGADPAPVARARAPEAEAPGPAIWPDVGAPLWRLAPVIAPGHHRVVIDPGHGAPGNDGNTGVLCQREADEMLRVGGVVVDHLERPGRLDVRTTRPGGAVVDYGSRIAMAESWGELLISLHSDARSGVDWGPDPSTGCNRSEGASGFAVLWSDEGDPKLTPERQRLAWAVSGAMIEAGFAPYVGGYGTLYAGDAQHPGVYVDRHEESQRIRMLRRPTIPSVIVETHNAPDPRDVARWREPATVEAFADALRVGISRFVAPRVGAR